MTFENNALDRISIKDKIKINVEDMNKMGESIEEKMQSNF